VMHWRRLRMRWRSPVVGLLCIVYGDWGCRRGRRGCSPAAVSRCCWGMVDPVSWGCTPLINNRAIRNIRIVPGLCSLYLHLFILYINIMLRHCLIHGAVRLKTQESKPSGFLFLLVVHYDHFCYTTISAEVAPQVCLCYAGR